VIKSKAGRLFLLGIFFSSYVFYLVWRGVYTLPLDLGIVPIIAGIMLLIAEIVGFLETVIFYITLWDIETPVTPEVHNTAAFPDVDVFVATYNEPLNIRGFSGISYALF
jgi:cellulose synthase (UDP-forming)